MIATVAVVPTEAGAGMLAEGPCGARVPTIWRFGDASKWWFSDHLERGDERALALAHAGAPVDLGMARALAVLARHVGRDPSRGVLWVGLFVPAWALQCPRQVDELWNWHDVTVPARFCPGLDGPSAPARSSAGHVRDAWALGVVLVHERLASRVILLDADGREVEP